MASLRKRPGTNIWQAQYYLPDPVKGGLKQVRKTTGETSRKKAMAVAIELERTAQGAVASGTDQSRLAKAIFAEVVAEIERGVFNVLSARKHLSKLLSIATGEELAEFTIATWSAEWLRRKARDSSKATMARYTGHVKSFLDWLGADRVNRPLESVTVQDARRWRESLQDAGRTGKTVLSYTKDIGAVYRAAIREGLVAFNPVSALEAVSTDDSHERKPFTAEEVALLIEAAPSEEWRGLIMLGANTGLRLGDAARLSWSAVDLEAKIISLMPSKTMRKKVTVELPIIPSLIDYFLGVTITGNDPAAPVFPTLSKLKPNGGTGLSSTFVRIMEAAGVDRGKASRELKEGQTAGRVTYEKGFHSLRHQFATRHRAIGTPEEDRMAMLGHSTRESHAIYSHVGIDAKRKAMEKFAGGEEGDA
jgi:integrase